MSAVSSLRLHDQVAVVNGERLSEPLVVGTIEARRVRLVPPRESAVEWWLYEDQHDVEIVRPDVSALREIIEGRAEKTIPTKPQPVAKPKRPASRTVEGIRLVSSGEGHWHSADGRYGVQLESGVTFCVDKHPVKITRQLRQWAEENHTRSVAQPVLSAIAMGRRGYLCPGDEEHGYPVWTIWVNGEVVDETGDTFAAALDIFGAEIRKAAAK